MVLFSRRRNDVLKAGFAVDVLNALDKLTDVGASNRHDGSTVVARLLPGVVYSRGVVRILVVFAFDIDVLINADTSINKVLLRQHGLKNGLTVSDINSMQVLSLDLLLSHNFSSIKSSQLGDVEESLEAVVLLILDRVIAHLQFCE
jgi:hypothetical protein